ncbi:MAG: hypothetical protein OSA37_05675 [Flavobacteriales bacterium]|nr:hypothetical protein [Flavobacteriales bacterium]
MMRLNSILTLVVATLPIVAFAQFSHVEVESVDNGGAIEGDTYRVYAVMQSEGDVIDAIFGEEGKPLEIKTTSTFYQHPNGGALASEVQRFDIQNDATLAFDSWVTIGLDDNYMNSLTGFLMDFSVFEQGQGLVTNNGAWFVTPDKRQAFAPSDKRILIAQLTTTGVVTGMINIHGRTRAIQVNDSTILGGDMIQAEGITFSCGK